MGKGSMCLPKISFDFILNFNFQISLPFVFEFQPGLSFVLEATFRR